MYLLDFFWSDIDLCNQPKKGKKKKKKGHKRGAFEFHRGDL